MRRTWPATPACPRWWCPTATQPIEAVENLLAYLPDNVDVEPERWPTDDPADRPCPEAGDLMPTTSTGSYDVRKVAEAIVDDGSLLELRERWAANTVTAFATIDGRPIGIVANQPMVLAGTLDIPGSQKAARFVAFCDAFNLPILTLVDTPGFYPGKDLEWRGMIRHGAQLVFAYARATVPRICVILRKSYGGAFIVMDSKTMGNDLCLAWPGAELAVMGAGQAAAILQRRATPEERAAFEADYTERLLNPYVAAERGYVDAVIDPADTRREIAAALDMLDDKRELLAPASTATARSESAVVRRSSVRGAPVERSVNSTLGWVRPWRFALSWPTVGATLRSDATSGEPRRSPTTRAIKEATCPTPSPSPTTARERPSPSRSKVGCSRRRRCANSIPTLYCYDPAYLSTASCKSAITYLDGDAGILRYRGYPIEQLAEKSTYLEVAYLLLNGELPDR